MLQGFLRTSTLPSAHARGVLSVSSHGSLVLSSSYDGTLALWRVDEHDQLRNVVTIDAGEGEGAVFSSSLSAFSDDKLLICAGTYARRVHAWFCGNPMTSPSGASGADGDLTRIFTSFQHTGWVRAMTTATVQPETTWPSRLYSVGCNRILGWELPEIGSDGPVAATGELPATEMALYEDEACVRSKDILCLAHDDAHEHLASGSVDGTIRCWVTSELSQLPELVERRPVRWMGHSGRVASLTWRTDGALLSCGYDGYVRSWRAGGTGKAWVLDSEVDVGRSQAQSSSAAQEASGRVLAVATAPAGALSGLALSGTSDGMLVALGRDLDVVASGNLLSSADGATGATAAPLRATAIVAMSERDEDEVARFVVGDSDGGLHVARVGAGER